MPIGHMEGNYFCGRRSWAAGGRGSDRLPLCDARRGDTAEANPNGSLSNIAGILSEKRNVLGMMPHPDRSSEKLLGSEDGWKVFASMVGALAAR